MDIQQTLKKNQEELLNKMNLRNNSLSFEENMSHMIALGEFSEAEKIEKIYTGMSENHPLYPALSNGSKFTRFKFSIERR